MSQVRAIGRSLARKERLVYGCGTNLYGHDPHHMAVRSLHRRGVRGATIRDVRLLGVHQPAVGAAWFSVTDGALGQCRSPRCQPM